MLNHHGWHVITHVTCAYLHQLCMGMQLNIHGNIMSHQSCMIGQRPASLRIDLNPSAVSAVLSGTGRSRREEAVTVSAVRLAGGGGGGGRGGGGGGA